MIEKALKTALSAHKGQLDKADQPYILHPLRLMMRMSTETEMIVAILHDVLEDSALMPRDLRLKGFSEEVVEAVVLLTRNRNMDYMSFIAELKHNPIARKVKMADLEDNMNLLRLPFIREPDIRRVQKYHQALTFLRRD